MNKKNNPQINTDVDVKRDNVLRYIFFGLDKGNSRKDCLGSFNLDDCSEAELDRDDE